MLFGIMGLLAISLNPGTAMVAVIAVGIAIDGSIHLLARYNELCRRTSDYAAAVRAVTPVSALRFDYERMRKDLKFFPNIVAKLHFNISYILGQRLADMVEKSKSA